MDGYTKKYLEAIKKAHTDEEKAALISKVYDDGFEDGANEG